MKTKFLIVLLFLISICSFSQQLQYKNGKILDSNNQKLSNSEVKELLGYNNSNNSLEPKKVGFLIDKMTIITNLNSVGIQLSF